MLAGEHRIYKDQSKKRFLTVYVKIICTGVVSKRSLLNNFEVIMGGLEGLLWDLVQSLLSVQRDYWNLVFLYKVTKLYSTLLPLLQGYCLARSVCQFSTKTVVRFLKLWTSALLFWVLDVEWFFNFLKHVYNSTQVLKVCYVRVRHWLIGLPNIVRLGLLLH